MYGYIQNNFNQTISNIRNSEIEKTHKVFKLAKI